MPTTVKSSEALVAFIKAANPGDSCVYHSGMLISDRAEETSRLAAADRQALDDLATLALELATQNEVCLFQRKVGFAKYEYVAIRNGFVGEGYSNASTVH